MSLSTRLPSELWCAIWEYLPFDDCVTVSHTCRYWRDAAVHCPSLWTELEFFSSPRAAKCECERCFTSASAPPLTNMRLILALAPRSGALPLRLSLFVDSEHADRTVLEQLGAGLTMCGANERIASIEATVRDPSVLRFLLGGMKRLPALTTIVSEPMDLSYVYGSIRRLDLEPWYDGEVEMPVLESLTLIGPLWPRRDVGTVTFPSLQDLTCSFSCPEEVATMVNACSDLMELHVLAFDSSSSWRLENRLEPNTLSELDRIPSIHVSGVTPFSEEWAIDNFCGSTRREFGLQYAEHAVPDSGVNLGLGLPDIELLALTFASPTRASLTLQSSRGIRRTLLFSGQHFAAISGALMEMFTHTCARSVKVLLVPGAYIPSFVTPEVVLPMLEMLIIADADLHAIAQPLSLSNTVPNLKVLQLNGVDEMPTVLKVDVVAAALECLCREGGRLERLVLCGIDLDGDAAGLEKYVDFVC